MNVINSYRDKEISVNPYPAGMNLVNTWAAPYTVSSIILTPNESVLYTGHYNGNLSKNTLVAPASLAAGITTFSWGGGVENTNRSIDRGLDGFTMIHSEGSGQSTIRKSMFSVSNEWVSGNRISDVHVVNVPSGHSVSPSGMSIKPDGLSVFLTTAWWQNPKGVFEMRTPVAWDFAQLVYNNHQISGLTWNPGQTRFTPDGMRAFMTDYTNNRILQWEVTTPWDFRTRITPASGNFALGYAPKDFVFAENGRKILITQESNTNVREYTLNPEYTIPI